MEDDFPRLCGARNEASFTHTHTHTHTHSHTVILNPLSYFVLLVFLIFLCLFFF